MSSASSDDERIENLEKKVKKKREKPRYGFSGQTYSSIHSQELKTYSNKCEQDKIKILVKLRQHIFFKNLPESNIEQIIKCMRSAEFKAGDVIIREGDIGNQLYLVQSGSYKCTISENPDQITYYGPGEAFGELALLYNTKRASTIVCEKSGKVFTLDRMSFNCILRDNVLKKTRMCEQILEKTQFFSTIKPYEKCKLIESLKEVSFPAGKYVIKEGQIGDKFYIVGEGKLVAQKMDEQGESKAVFYFKEGDYFGQIALIKNVPRQASVKTLTSTKLMYIDRNKFKRLLGPLEQILRRNEDRYKSMKESIKKNII